MAAEELFEGDNWYRVCLNTIVRKGQKLDSERLRILPMGSKVLVKRRVDRRVEISKPLEGWCSLKSSNGDTILTKMAKDEAHPETPSNVNVHERVEREREHYQNIQNAMASQVEASGLGANDKHEIQNLIIGGDIDKLKNKIRAVESQLEENTTREKNVVEQLQRKITEAENVSRECEELEKIAQMKVEELKEIQGQMQLAMTSQIKGVSEDGSRPLEPGCVVQLGAGTHSVLGIVRYIGPVDGQPGSYIGLEMESGGDTTGTYEGKKYFEVASPEKGMFFPADQLTRRLFADSLLLQLVKMMNKLAQESTTEE